MRLKRLSISTEALLTILKFFDEDNIPEDARIYSVGFDSATSTQHDNVQSIDLILSDNSFEDKKTIGEVTAIVNKKNIEVLKEVLRYAKLSKTEMTVKELQKNMEDNKNGKNN